MFDGVIDELQFRAKICIRELRRTVLTSRCSAPICLAKSWSIHLAIQAALHGTMEELWNGVVREHSASACAYGLVGSSSLRFRLR